MADIAELILDVRAQGAAQLPGLNANLMSVAGAGDRAAGSLRGVADSLLSVKGMIAGGFFGGLARDLLSVNAEYEQLGVTLKHVLKDQTLANEKFEELRDLAAKTPMSVADLTKSFTRLKSLGLDASTSTIRAFGDIASAIPGKTIGDFVEAVADATQGQGRRLKEFGIDLSKVGDEFEITFGGVTQRVKNDAGEIQAALLRVAQTEFGGLMAAQAETTAGKFSTLKDEVDALMVAIGEGGLNTAIKESIDVMTGAAGESDALAVALGKGLGGAVRSVTGILDTAMKSLSRWLDVGGQVVGLIERIPGAKALMESSSGGGFAAGGGAGLALALNDAIFGSDPIMALLSRATSQTAVVGQEFDAKSKAVALRDFLHAAGETEGVSALTGWLGKMTDGFGAAGDSADKAKGKVKDLKDEIESLMFFDTGLGLKGFTPDEFKDFQDTLREAKEGSYDVLRDTGTAAGSDAIGADRDEARLLADLRAGLPGLTAQVQQEADVRAFADSPFGKFVEDSTLSLEKLESVGLSVFDSLTDSMIEFITTGKTNWDDLFKSIFANLLKLAANSLLGEAIGGFAPAGGAGFTAGIFHAGGIVGAGGPTRPISPLAFVGAPRYHGGGMAGLRPDEVPAILQRGERVIPRGGSAGGIGKVIIQTTDADSFGRNWPSTLRRLRRLGRGR